VLPSQFQPFLLFVPLPGALGGLLGALFIHLNVRITQFRHRHIPFRWVAAAHPAGRPASGGAGGCGGEHERCVRGGLLLDPPVAPASLQLSLHWRALPTPAPLPHTHTFTPSPTTIPPTQTCTITWHFLDCALTRGSCCSPALTCSSPLKRLAEVVCLSFVTASLWFVMAWSSPCRPLPSPVRRSQASKRERGVKHTWGAT
jgi:hypothetical protein